MITINVQNKTFTTSRTVNKVIYDVITVILNESATVAIRLLDSNDSVVDCQNILIDGKDYANWGLDDTYLENLVLRKLGLTKA